MIIKLLTNFKREPLIAGVKIRTLKTLCEKNKLEEGIVAIDQRTLGCVKLRYRLKCKSSQCFMIQKEIKKQDVGYHKCHACHLAFLEAYETGEIQLKK